jgi:hypothetical protein
MLKSLKVEGYRGFERYEMRDLARVNLLVGQNNCGKTSLLEAVRVLARGGDVSVLRSIALERGEVVYPTESDERYTRDAYPVVSHFFHGHELELWKGFTVAGSGTSLSVEISIVDWQQEGVDESQRRLFSDYPDEIAPVLAIFVDRKPKASPPGSGVFPLTDQGAFASRRYAEYYRRFAGTSLDLVLPAIFISPDSLEPQSMTQMWNDVLEESRESDVIEAMRILEPRLGGVYFLSGAAPVRFGGRGGVLVGLEGSKRRVPLGTFGDGMRRLLALSLAIAQSSGGVLLIDEIDTGLHYSVMGDMWRMVVATAERLNAQVFATTHSFDCIRGLAWLCNNYPDLGEHVSLQKIEPELDQSVALGAAEIVMAVEQGMEVR